MQILHFFFKVTQRGRNKKNRPQYLSRELPSLGVRNTLFLSLSLSDTHTHTHTQSLRTRASWCVPISDFNKQEKKAKIQTG